jgi:sugar phosphate isomerase/epimerase
MAKATLEFDISNPDEAADLAACLAARNLIGAVSDFEELLRKAVKYGSFQGTQLTPEQIDTAEKLRAAFWADIDDRGLRKIVGP